MLRVAHFDADAFFASVEQAADRRLRGRAIAVGGGSRGVICSASYEARKFGVRSAMPTRRALELCPELLIIRGQFELYERFSEQIFAYGEALTPYVERSSIDEGYLDFRGSGDPERLVRQMRGFDRDICGSLKITVSCGLAVGKRIAMIAGKVNKPHGFVVIPRGNESGFLAPLPIGALPGLGPVSVERLQSMGFRQIRDLLKAGPQILQGVLGARTAGILELARGIDEEPVQIEKAAAKSFNEQHTFEEDMGSEETVEKCLVGLLERQLRRMRESGQLARLLAVTVRYTDYEEKRASHNLSEPENIAEVFLPHLRKLLKKAWVRRVRLRQVRLQLGNLYPDWSQGELFDRQRTRWRQMASVQDQLAKSFGEKALVRASVLSGKRGGSGR